MDTDTVAERNGNWISIFLFSFLSYHSGCAHVCSFILSYKRKLLCVRYTDNMLMCGVFNPFIL